MSKDTKYGFDGRGSAGEFAEAVLWAQSSNDELNRNARYNLWEGQSEDGRKWHPRRNDREVMPWRGASDCRVPMVDSYIGEDAGKLVVGLYMAQLRASGLEVGDTAWGARATNVIRWQLFSQMTELFREASLLANYLKECGKGVLGVLWERRTQLGYVELKMAMLEEVAGKAQEMLLASEGAASQGEGGGGGQSLVTSTATSGESQSLVTSTATSVELTDEQRVRLVQATQLVEIFMDSSREDEAMELLQEHGREVMKSNFAQVLGEFEDELLEEYEVPKAAARRMVRELRETGGTDMAIPTVVRNGPVLVALRPGEDCFLPKDCGDFEKARVFWRIEWLSEEELRERVVSMKWDEAWVEAVVEKCRGATFKSVGVGRSTETVGEITLTASQAARFTGSGAEATGRDDREMERDFFVVHQYQRRCDESGVPGIWYTVFHPGLMGSEDSGAAQGSVDEGETLTPGFCGVDELMTYDHGVIPYVYFREEYLSRKATDSRGYGEVGFTWQNTVKTELDMEIDRSVLATNPPLHHPRGRPPAKWGAGVRVAGTKSEYHYADIPRFDPGAREVGTRMWHMADRRFGRPTFLPDGTPGDAVGPQIVQKYKMLVWLEGWKQAITQLFQLDQQFMPNEFFYRIIGTQDSQPMRASREEIQGKFDLSIGFDDRRFDPEHLQAMLDWIIKLRQSVDTSARIDPDELVIMALEWLDPNLPERLIRPKQAADEAEVDDTKNVVTRMAAGLDEDVKLSGQNWGLRLGVVNDLIFGTNPQKPQEPKNPELFQRFQQDEGFRTRVGKYMQQLQFQQNEHTVNAQQGRLGG